MPSKVSREKSMANEFERMSLLKDEKKTIVTYKKK